MTTIDLYKKHKAGEISREKFLYEVRRDAKLPWIINITSYDDAVKILKNKGIIRESYDNQVGQHFDLDVTSHRGNGVQKYQLKNVKLVNTNGRVFEKPDGTTVVLAPSDEYTSQKVEDVKENIEEAPIEEMSHEESPIEEKEQKPVEKEIVDYVVELGKNPTKKELGIYFGENSLLEKEENALLRHYGYYKSEDVIEVLKWKRRSKDRRREFAENEEPLNEAKKKQPKTVSADHVNAYQYRLGIQYELECSNDYTDAGLDKAKAKTLKNLAKDSNYYTTLLNADKSHYTFKTPESQEPNAKSKLRPDGRLKKELEKNAKSNVSDSGNKEKGNAHPKGVKEMTMTPKKAKGISKVMDMPGKPKVVKEGVSFKDFFLTENEEAEVDKKAKNIAKIKSKLKKETKLVKSKTTGATIDIVPDSQVSDIQASLAKKGVQITTTDV